MATKKTTQTKTAKPAAKPAAKGGKTTKGKAAPKAPKAPKQTVKQTARHPKAKVLEAHGGKEALAKAIASVIARGDEDGDSVADRLKTASNAQLLRLSRVSETVKKKWGSRDKLIAAIGAATNKAKDQDYLTKLGTFSLPQLVHLAASHERRARS